MASVKYLDENTIQVVICYGYKTNGQKKRKKRNFKLDPTLSKRKREEQKEKFIQSFKDEVLSNKYLNSDMRFIDFSKKYMKDYAKEELSITTYKRYETLLEKINLEIGELKLSEIKPPHIREFKRRIANYKKKVPIKDSNGKTIGQAEEKIAPKTQLHYFNLLSGILTYAVQEDYITDNPCSKVKSPKVPKKEAPFIDIETIKVMLKLLENEPIHYRVFINLLLYTAIRRRRAELH